MKKEGASFFHFYPLRFPFMPIESLKKYIGVYECVHYTEPHEDVSGSLTIQLDIASGEWRFSFRIHHYSNHGYFNITATGKEIKEQNNQLILLSKQGTRSGYENVYKDESVQAFQASKFLFVEQVIDNEICLHYTEYLFIPTSDIR